MRVVHVSAYYAPAFVYGGPPRSIHGLCRGLLRRGIEVQVFTTDANGPIALPADVTSARTFEGVPVRYFPRTWPLEPIGSRQLALALRRAVARADVVHIHGLWNRVVWAAAGACVRAGVPYVLSPRGMLEDGAVARHRWRKQIAFAMFERRTIEQAALIHATSERERDTLQRWRSNAATAVVPNGVDLREQGAGAPDVDLSIPRNKAVVLFVGRLHAIKRIDLLLDAFAVLHARRPETHLVIAGPDEHGLRPRLEQHHARLRDAVSWAGLVDEPRRQALLRAARALVLCSDSESFGMSVVEALAESTPVVVTDTCGWSVIERAQAGVMVKQSADAIAQAIETLVDDARLAETMGNNGRRLVESTFTWDAVAAALAGHYEAVRERATVAVQC